MKRFLFLILACAAAGAVASLGLHFVLRDATGFLAENRAAVTGGVAGMAAVLVVNLFFRKPAKQ